MKVNSGVLVLVCLALTCLSAAADPEFLVTVHNPLAISRASETIELPAQVITDSLGTKDFRQVRIIDSESGRELTIQAIDADGNGMPEILIFQSDFAPRQSRKFRATTGPVRYPALEEFRAYGRFVRERFDDFAWENDRIAHRMYGQALETWEKEPLTSSAVDIWCKRVRRLVINDWYMVDNYHTDTGEGADFYSAGRSRGCGGSGVWDGGKLHVSRNFINSRVLANGPIRVLFELIYAPWDVNGRRVSEVKRISLDAGQNLDRFQSEYTTDGMPGLMCGIGIKKNAGSSSSSNSKAGWLRSWEPIKGDNGSVGCAVILDPSLVVQTLEADGNYLVLAQVPTGKLVYHAGFGWDKSGDFSQRADWERYVEQAAQRLAAPLEVTIEN